MAVMATRPLSVRADEIPETYPRGRRCPACSCYLNRYNAGPLCHPCSPGGEGGVVIQVQHREWRRFQLVDLIRNR